MDLVERAALRSILTAEPTEFAVDWTVRCERESSVKEDPNVLNNGKDGVNTFTKARAASGGLGGFGSGVRSLGFVLSFCSASL